MKLRKINTTPSKQCSYDDGGKITWHPAVLTSQHDHRALLRVLRAAAKVVYWDWHDNDDECVADIESLRKAVRAFERKRK